MEKKEQEKLLHETILELFYYESKDKLCELNQSEIFRKLKDPSVSQFQLDQVLNWMVHHKKLNEILGFYTIDKYELIDLEEKFRNKDKETKIKEIKPTINIEEDTSKIIKTPIPNKLPNKPVVRKTTPKKKITVPVVVKPKKYMVITNFIIPVFLVIYTFFVFFLIQSFHKNLEINNTKVEIALTKINQNLSDNKTLVLSQNKNEKSLINNNVYAKQVDTTNEANTKTIVSVYTGFNHILNQVNNIFLHLLFLILGIILLHILKNVL